MRLCLPVALCMSILLCSFGNQQAPARCTYGTIQGRFDGKYVSYYPNGKKKAEGRFRNNYREGKWQLWDQSGELITERNYMNPFEFKQVYPKIRQESSLFPVYKLERDNNGCYKQFTIAEDRIMASKKVWRFIAEKNNPFLFSSENRLFRVIDDAVQNGSLKPYSNDALTIPVNPGPANTDIQKIIGFKIMESWFIDKDRLVSQYQTLTLCPVAMNIRTGDTTDLYWINLNQARPAMSKEYMNDVPLPRHIETLDDIFFFHYFYGQIYTESGANTPQPAQLIQSMEIEQASLKTDLSMIDDEHNTWLTIYK
jgi:hypothetical protein